MARWLSSLRPRLVVLWGFICAAAMEIVTCALRFGLNLQAQRDTAWLAPLTLGLHLHHGYFGIPMLILAPLTSSVAWRNLLLILGVGLVASDIVHHFLVLWPLTGHPEFYLRYSH